MQLGRHLHELWRIRVGIALSAMVAALAAVWSVATIQVAPPGLTPRNTEMAAASTRVLVDAPYPSVLDLSVSVNDFEGMKNRALLVGNIMATAPVREYIARRAGVSPRSLQMSSPVTPDWPRALASNGNPRRTTDILNSPDQYRLNIQVNPTVPVVDVYAQAPELGIAKRLADATVRGMEDYLRDLGVRDGVPRTQQVHLQQLGSPTGGTVNAGVSRKLALLTFVLVFAVSGMAVLFLARVRRGWRQEAATQRGIAVAGAVHEPAS
jgi:hypothetical protein